MIHTVRAFLGWIIRYHPFSFTPPKLTDNGKSTIWRCISYWKWWCPSSFSGCRYTPSGVTIINWHSFSSGPLGIVSGTSWTQEDTQEISASWRHAGNLCLRHLEIWCLTGQHQMSQWGFNLTGCRKTRGGGWYLKRFMQTNFAMFAAFCQWLS